MSEQNPSSQRYSQEERRYLKNSFITAAKPPVSEVGTVSLALGIISVIWIPMPLFLILLRMADQDENIIDPDSIISVIFVITFLATGIVYALFGLIMGISAKKKLRDVPNAKKGATVGGISTSAVGLAFNAVIWTPFIYIGIVYSI